VHCERISPRFSIPFSDRSILTNDALHGSIPIKLTNPLRSKGKKKEMEDKLRMKAKLKIEDKLKRKQKPNT